MSVPLDRLYDFLHDVCNQDVIIYRFSPHGSKKVEHLIHHTNNDNVMTNPIMVCHDQEPLNWSQSCNENGCVFRTALPMTQRYKHFLLLHSEQNSKDLVHFANDRIFPVYHWSHALIARDWFRYAEIDPVLNNESGYKSKDFLVYQRAWTGTREYRLTFTELLLNLNLQNNCVIKFNPVDDNTHYSNHTFQNPALKISRFDFEDLLPLNNTPSDASADYQNQDYITTNIEVVLETLFDDSRWHLTEKILRPIACGHPFILASSPGSLKYLNAYGFKTFEPYIDQSYDQEQNPLIRLKMIADEMRRISNLNQKQKTQFFENIKGIAKQNQQYFFSKSFLDIVIAEYKQNLKSALDQWNMLSRRSLNPRQAL